jgi:leader peptidase (prepilin peptidase) / N-methyltransferase
MSILVFALLGMIAGGLANWAADTLPGRGTASVRHAHCTDATGVLHNLTLPWYAFRAGVCPHCGQRRPWRCPAVELAMVITFAVTGWLLSAQPGRAAILCGYAWFLITVLVIDLEHRRVLNVLVAPAALLALVASFLPGMPSPTQALLGGALAFAAFLLLALAGRGAMGMGDVKLAGVIGLMTGYPLVLPALFAGIVFGAFAAGAMLLTRRAARKTAIAYAPYLSLGALLVLMLFRK